jgi:ribosomal protein S18 acetylase RimI-like enzyme
LAEKREYEITEAKSPEEIAAAKSLFLEYQKWLNVDLCFQDFDNELATLPGKYASPDGRLYLVKSGDEYTGCVGLRKIEDGVCEMKRLYIKLEHQGHGLGKKLIELIIKDAKSIGYKKMRLDTIKEKMPNAVDLYEKRGFKKIDAYYGNPDPHTLYMELDLQLN